MKKIYSPLSLRTLLTACLILTGFYSMAQPDAGVTSITEPTGPLCPGTTDVKAVLHNFGPDSLISVTLQWSVDGVLQPSISYTDTLVAGQEDTVTLGSVTFAAATAYDLVAYTENPNGGIDSDPSNDTASVSGLEVFLSGTYTIGGATPDFATFPDAIDALNNFGVCGPVTFNIRPILDTIKVALNAVAGASATNTILFQAENGDSSSVVFTQASANLGMNDYLIRLSGADYVTLCRLTLQRTGNGNLQHILDFTNSATFNTIIFCHLIGGTPLATGTQGALIYSSALAPTNDSSNNFSYNLFEGGSYGIYMNGLSLAVLEANNLVTGNIFINQTTRGVHFNFQRNPRIENNTISSASTNTVYAGIYLLRDQGDIRITKNKVFADHGFGMYLNNCSSSAVTPGLVTNNFLSSGDSATLRILACSYQNILNNSLLTHGTGLSSLFVSGNGSGNIVQNNILANSGGGYCYHAGSLATSGILLSDYNNFFTSGPIVANYGGVDAATVTDWINVTGQDNNSVSIDPQFVSTIDLHATSSAMDNLGLTLGYVSDDIDGEARSVTPDIGADEYTAGSHDLSVTAWLAPVDSSCGQANLEVSLIISNLGAAPAGAFNVVVNLNGIVSTQLSQPHPGTLQPGATDTITIFSALSTEAGGVLMYEAYTDYAFDDSTANDTLSGAVIILPIPVVLITESSICGGGQVVLSVAAADSVDWFDAPAGGNLLFTGNSFTTPPLSSTTVFYAAVRNPCAGGRFPVTATVFSPPVVFLGNDTIASDSVLLDAGAGFVTYAWNTLDSTQTIMALASGTYSVLVTDFNGCTATDTIIVTILTGLKETSMLEEIRIYPNPASDKIVIDAAGLLSGPADLSIHNSLGQLVYSSRFVPGQSELLIVPVSEWSAGVYSVDIRMDSHIRSIKLMVH